ncbi:hypothetical protein TNCV_1215701 [Trichonephila clavipes]|nr:hypothetical protein TNCV_1215701 [Trichonephila clavipes]
MEGVSDQSFIPSDIGRVDDEEMIPPAHGVSQADHSPESIIFLLPSTSFHRVRRLPPSQPPSRGQHLSLSLSLGEQGGTLAALVSSCQRWERIPWVKKLRGGHASTLRLTAAACTCEASFHKKEADHRC